MNDRLRLVLDDLAAQSQALDDLVAYLEPEQWRLATPAVGWDVATQIAHLAWTDEAALAAATDKQRWDDLVLQAMDDPLHFVDKQAAAGAQASSEELLARWRRGRAALAEALASYPAGEKVPWYGPAMSPTSMATARFMETWAHGRDIADALGQLAAPDDRVRHVVHLGVRTRDFSFDVHGLTAPAEEFRIELVAPSGETWTYGPEDAEQSVTGSAFDFALLVTQRRHPTDVDLIAKGEDARKWLTIAQAFAGPPGRGRTAGEAQAG